MKLLIRADANARIGTGHVMRCLSLAQGWKRLGGEAVFAVTEIPPLLEDRLHTAGIDFVKSDCCIGSPEDAEQTIELANQHRADWIIADGYSFGAEYQHQIKRKDLRLLVLDDYAHAKHYFADFILNQNLHARDSLYPSREAGTQLLLGNRYALLREEFFTYQDWKRSNPAAARKVLVTMGGADPDNVTEKVMRLLPALNVEARVIVGGSNPHLEKLRAARAGLNAAMELVVDARNMSEHMAWADVAVSAGGSTSLELAFMGLPSAVIVLADNQRGAAEAMAAMNVTRITTPENLATDLATLLGDQSARLAMSERGRELVDGKSVSRIMEALSEP